MDKNGANNLHIITVLLNNSPHIDILQWPQSQEPIFWLNVCLCTWMYSVCVTQYFAYWSRSLKGLQEVQFLQSQNVYMYIVNLSLSRVGSLGLTGCDHNKSILLVSTLLYDVLSVFYSMLSRCCHWQMLSPYPLRLIIKPCVECFCK